MQGGRMFDENSSRFVYVRQGGSDSVSVPAVLALADGTIFRGQSIGAKGNTTGEVVFNTALTGYQEILTDPSYARQIVTLTCPHIGNTGATPEDLEAAQIYPAGLIIRDLPIRSSNWRANESLPGGRHRRHRHAAPHPPAARERRAGGLHHDGREGRRSRRHQAGAQVSGP